MDFSSDASLSPEEKAFYTHVFNLGDLGKKGFWTAQEAVQLWKRSKLSDQVLGQIWNMVDKDPQSNVFPKGFAQGMRLMAAAQASRLLDKPLMDKRKILHV